MVDNNVVPIVTDFVQHTHHHHNHHGGDTNIISDTLITTIGDKTKHKEYVLNRTVADLLAGSFAGISGKIVEYPFDTIKVKLQCQEVNPNKKPMGTYQCARDILRYDGLRGFYRGLSAPLIGSVMENAVLFVAYGRIQKLFQNGSDKPLSVPQLSAAGAIAGMAVSAVLTPVELIKCKIQIHSKTYKGPIDCAIKTIRATGLRGLYKGHFATFARESCGGAAWFGVYEFTCRRLSGSTSKDNLSPGSLMFAGALSGIAYNSVLFPMDVVKSQIQSESSGDRNYLRRLKKLYLAEGVRGLYRGFGITLIRAVPSNASILASFELMNRALKY
jgi:ornithine carrier protein